MHKIKIMEVAKFLILQSPRKENIGTITERSAGFFKPSLYQISEEELDLFKAMSDHAKQGFIAEKLALNASVAPVEKKNVEVAVKVAEPVLVETPEIAEPLNEPINEIVESVNENTIESVESIEVKPKGRPKKVK